ncbi:MAG: DeoR/GlpR transcriptional regulator [Lentisphaeria bacterium]|nr:DeoR/GlpR transcriptional regulator [Lentisphaeria bacterium]
MQKRRDAILKFIEANGESSIASLAERFSEWSEMTIRRDLAFLEKERSIILTRGGARAVQRTFGLSEDIYSEREQRNREAKMLVASKAAGLIDPGKAIFIDSGSSAMALARAVPDQNCVIITSAPNVALEIIRCKSKPQVVLLGGTLGRRSLAVSAYDLETQLSQFNIDIAFLGVSGFDLRAGCTVGTQDDCLLKKQLIKQARRSVVLLDSSKLGVAMPFTYAAIEDIGTVVSDGNIPAEAAEEIAKKTTLL